MASYDEYYNDPALETARTAASSAASNVADMSKSINILPYKLRDAINEKLDYNKDLITQKNKAMEDYFAAPAEGRQQYSDIWNPTQREALVSRNTAQKYTPYANLQDILATRQGGIENLIGAAGANARADLTASTDQASLLRQQYEDLLGMADKKTQLGLDVARMKQSGSGGSDIAGLGEMFAKILGVGGDTAPTGLPAEPKPTQTPTNPNVHWQSPGGEWEYNFQYKSWVPSGAELTE
jgi:hypothetical protein